MFFVRFYSGNFPEVPFSVFLQEYICFFKLKAVKPSIFFFAFEKKSIKMDKILCCHVNQSTNQWQRKQNNKL